MEKRLFEINSRYIVGIEDIGYGKTRMYLGAVFINGQRTVDIDEPYDSVQKRLHFK